MIRLSFVLMGVGLIATLLGCSASDTNPPKTASSYTLIQEPEAGYQLVYDFISSANQTIDMTMYALADPDAEAALIAAAKKGVAVRVLLDSDHSDDGNSVMSQPAYDNLQANGVNVAYSWSGVLWHQKSIVVDSAKVAIMNCNFVAEYYPILRDFIVITDNPATVAGVEATFNSDYKNTDVAPITGVVPPDSELVWSPGAENEFVKLIGSAQSGTILYTETEQLDSLVIDQALIDAVRRGVTVNLIMTDSPSYAVGFNTLKAGGVNVGLHPSNGPLYIQAKAISVNNDTVYIGSTNFTTTSMSDDRNVGIITKDPTIVKGITSTLTSDFLGATPY